MIKGWSKKIKMNIYERIYSERVVNSLEYFLDCIYKEPFSHSEELTPHNRFEALKMASDGLLEELNNLYWTRIKALINEWVVRDA